MKHETEDIGDRLWSVPEFAIVELSSGMSSLVWRESNHQIVGMVNMELKQIEIIKVSDYGFFRSED